MHLKSTRSLRRAVAGFTLVELLVTMFIVSVGMLGLVKLEAAGVSESRVSRIRSLMTFQAESLAGLMRADRGFWAATTSPFPSVSYNTATDSSPVLSSTIAANGTDPTCSSTTVVCKPSEMAYADLSAWAANYKNAFPGATAAVACTTPSGAACSATSGVPTSYDITLTWSEKTVAVNRSSTGSTATVSMVLHVQP